MIFGDKIYLWGKYGSNTVELYKISSDDNLYTSVSCSKDYLFAINIQGQIESVNIILLAAHLKKLMQSTQFLRRR